MGVPAVAGNLLTAAVLAGTLAVGAAFAFPPAAAAELFAPAPVAAVFRDALDAPGSVVLFVAETNRGPDARPAGTVISSSFDIRPGPVPAKAGGSVTTRREIRIDVDRSVSANGGNNVVSHDRTFWIYCDPQSLVKQALCDAHDTAGASSPPR